jgi:arylsulfatase A-like enzyme/predicted aspartyl protease
MRVLRKGLGRAVVLLAACVAGRVYAEGGAAPRPNFVFLLSDDQRFDALGVVQREQGERGRFPWFETPALDRLAAEGVRFRNAFVVSALCSPSRAAFLTGRYNHSNGIANNRTPFPAGAVTFASLLRAAGYRTGYAGKWHMGPQRGARPGFDFSASFVGQGRYIDCPIEVDGKSTPSTGWVDDVVTGYAIEFLKREKEKPFLLCLGFKAPHGPRTAPERLKERFAGKEARPAPNAAHAPPFLEREEYSTPAARNRNAKSAKKGTRAALAPPGAEGLRTYFRQIAAVDENVGRVLAALDELKLAETTVVVFTSDNGYYLGEHGLGDKRTAYEESMRIPLLLRYPKLGAAAKGKTIDAMALNIDLAPTFLDFAGVSAPKEMQGRSWRPLLEGGAVEWRKAFFYEYFYERNFRAPPVLGLRTETAKLIRYPGFESWTELFDLEKDPYETRNLAGERKEQLESMGAELERRMEALEFRAPEGADPLPAGEYPKTAAATPERSAVNPLGIGVLDAETVRSFALEGQSLFIGTVIPGSPAALAGLKAGDRIVRVDGKETPRTADLSEILKKLEVGKRFSVDYVRRGVESRLEAALTGPLPEFSGPDEREHIEMLEGLVASGNRGRQLRSHLAMARFDKGDRDKAFLEIQDLVDDFPELPELKVRHLELLYRSGRFDRLLLLSEHYIKAHPESTTLALMPLVLRFASDRYEELSRECMRIFTEAKAKARSHTALCVAAYWLLSEIYSGAIIAAPAEFAWLVEADENRKAAAALRFWLDGLAGKRAYDLDPNSKPSELSAKFVLSNWNPGTPTHCLLSVEANGASLDRCLVDTSSTFVRLTFVAAKKAGVRFLEQGEEIDWLGTVPVKGRAGMIDEFRIGEILLRNLPVVVSEHLELGDMDCDAFLGRDLMHAVRLFIDYPNRKVKASPAATPLPPLEGQSWEIPLWTLPQGTIALGEYPEGKDVKVLIDSGRPRVTLFAPKWAKARLPDYRADAPSAVEPGSSDPRLFSIKGLKLAGVGFPEWPVYEAPEWILRGYAQEFDLLMGLDLLWPYRVTIDMRGRRLLLEPSRKD